MNGQTQADVKAANELLHVYPPKKNKKGWCEEKNGGDKCVY
jgi:hypothetical protein